eukprot:4454952-Amphidinium_carterae.1
MGMTKPTSPGGDSPLRALGSGLRTSAWSCTSLPTASSHNIPPRWSPNDASHVSLKLFRSR